MLDKRQYVRIPVFLLAMLLVLAPQRAARADDPREAARGHYARGLELASQGGYEAALQEFSTAYGINPHFAVLYNIAQCHVALGHPLEAIETLSKYLAEGQSQIPRERREQVEAQVALMETHLARITVTSDRPGALVTIDGRELGRTPLAQPARVAAGTHTIAAASVGGAPAVSRIVTLGEGEHQVVNLELPAPPIEAKPVDATSTITVQCSEAGAKVLVDGQSVDLATAMRGIPVTAGVHRIAFASAGRTSAEQNLDVPVGGKALVFCGAFLPAVSVDNRAESAERRRGTGSIAGYVLGGAGVVLGGAAFAHYLWNKGRYDDWRNTQSELPGARGTPGYYDRQVANNDLADSIDRASHVSVGLAVAGGALLGGGVTLWLIDRAGGGRETKDEHPAARMSGFTVCWANSSGSVSWRGAW